MVNYRFILKGIVSLAMVAGLMACSNQQEGASTKSNATAHNDEQQKKAEKESVQKTPENLTETDANKTEETKNEISLEKMKKVGKEGFGYVQVPLDWVNFKDVNPNTSYQISSKDGSQIISINVFKDAGKDANEETYANIVAANMESGGGQDIKGAKVTLGKYDALQVYGSYKEGTYFVVAWVFKGEDGQFHYISAEGPKENILQVVGYVEKGGWSLK
ncbi:hypothetical protein [Neobacillus mesonae]|uniref:hypothetical protein n=1 Tax=Neobacillus mesonae TaxID=1193713 RepID=UPI002041E7A8|nr:hypothetical protein [Neobacillus mesonae]MCM3570837.1 hypothetical protein [Neobacillus mesonae]